MARRKDECDDKTDTFNVDLKVGKWSSDPFDNTDRWQKGNAIEDLLRRIRPKGSEVCLAGCTEGNAICLAKSVTADIPKGKGKFKRTKVDNDVPDFIYYLHITDNCTVKFTVKCNCVPFPD